MHNRGVGDVYRKRRIIIAAFMLVCFCFLIVTNTPNPEGNPETRLSDTSISHLAIDELSKLSIKGRAPKTGYSRDKFGAGWQAENGCDTRNVILNRDMSEVVVDEDCKVVKGVLGDPYSGKEIEFLRGSSTSGAIQIDHVVALSDAWQKGAQLLSQAERIKLANDPLELLAVDGPLNIQKSDGDAATWLPPNKSFRCRYVARQIAVKIKYALWVTIAEHDSIESVLRGCQNEVLPSP